MTEKETRGEGVTPGTVIPRPPPTDSFPHTAAPARLTSTVAAERHASRYDSPRTAPRWRSRSVTLTTASSPASTAVKWSRQRPGMSRVGWTFY